MLQVLQCDLRSRIEITGALCAPALREAVAERDWTDMGRGAWKAQVVTAPLVPKVGRGAAQHDASNARLASSR
jgi:hypothetical protein